MCMQPTKCWTKFFYEGQNFLTNLLWLSNVKATGRFSQIILAYIENLNFIFLWHSQKICTLLIRPNSEVLDFLRKSAKEEDT